MNLDIKERMTVGSKTGSSLLEIQRPERARSTYIMYRIPTNGKKLERNVPDRTQAAWIVYQLNLAGISQREIAKKANVTPTMVRSVICGRKTSPRVQLIIAHSLGQKNWAELVTDHRKVAA